MYQEHTIADLFRIAEPALLVQTVFEKVLAAESASQAKKIILGNPKFIDLANHARAAKRLIDGSNLGDENDGTLLLGQEPIPAWAAPYFKPFGDGRCKCISKKKLIRAIRDHFGHNQKRK